VKNKKKRREKERDLPKLDAIHRIEWKTERKSEKKEKERERDLPKLDSIHRIANRLTCSQKHVKELKSKS